LRICRIVLITHHYLPPYANHCHETSSECSFQYG
jgi:hypothetical protein